MVELYLIGAESKHYEDYYLIRSSPSDIEWNGYTSKPDKDAFHELFLNRLATARFEKPEDRRLYLIGLREESKETNIGFVQLIKREDGVEIGYSVMDDYQGKGYATKALAQGILLAKQHSKSVYVRIRDDNIASQKVALKNGFRRTKDFTVKDYPKCGKVKLRKYSYPK